MDDIIRKAQRQYDSSRSPEDYNKLVAVFRRIRASYLLMCSRCESTNRNLESVVKVPEVCPVCCSLGTVKLVECTCHIDFDSCGVHKDLPAYVCGEHGIRHADGCWVCWEGFLRDHGNLFSLDLWSFTDRPAGRSSQRSVKFGQRALRAIVSGISTSDLTIFQRGDKW